MMPGRVEKERGTRFVGGRMRTTRNRTKTKSRKSNTPVDQERGGEFWEGRAKAHGVP